jgi:hypothetical protein
MRLSTSLISMSLTRVSRDLVTSTCLKMHCQSVISMLKLLRNTGTMRNTTLIVGAGVIVMRSIVAFEGEPTGDTCAICNKKLKVGKRSA